MPTLIFFDVEVTGLNGQGDLISLGVISDDARHRLYLENSHFSPRSCAPEIAEEVLPQLQGGGRSMPMDVLALRLAIFLHEIGPDVVAIVTDRCSQEWFAKILDSQTGLRPDNVLREAKVLNLHALPDTVRDAAAHAYQRPRRRVAIANAEALRDAWVGMRRIVGTDALFALTD